MWIRSQSRVALVKVTSVSVYQNGPEDYRINGTNENCIAEQDYFELGRYKTEKRAIEVLDEIQNCCAPIDLNGRTDEVLTVIVGNIWRTLAYTYQMPEE